MTEKPPEPDESAIDGDIAALYARAHLQGTRYWDFSASRQEVQGQFRHRIAREHAERAVSPFGRPSTEQHNARQFQSPPAPLAEAATASRNGPVLAPQQGTAAQAQADPGELDTVSSGGSSKPYPVPPLQPQPAPEPAEDTRWYALHSVFEPAKAPVEPPSGLPLGFAQRPPVLAVLSIAGGVGKTCVTATLGRALSAFGEHVLLADTNAAGSLPFYYGARASKPGVVRTFSPPTTYQKAPAHEPIQLLSLQASRYPGDADCDLLLARLVRDGQAASRILIDVATADRDVTSRLLRLRPTALVPILPDINSVASLAPLQELLADQTSFYLLNQFDPGSALHRDVRAMLQLRLGESLLPIAVRRSSAVSESLAEGLTVIDYAPDSTAAEDYRRLAEWLRTFAAPAVLGGGGMRWSER